MIDMDAVRALQGKTHRRLVKVAISDSLMDETMREGYETVGKIRCVEGIPIDASLVGTFTEYPHGPELPTAYFIYTHNSFAEIGPNDETPERRVMFERVANA